MPCIRRLRLMREMDGWGTRVRRDPAPDLIRLSVGTVSVSVALKYGPRMTWESSPYSTAEYCAPLFSRPHPASREIRRSLSNRWLVRGDTGHLGLMSAPLCLKLRSIRPRRSTPAIARQAASALASPHSIPSDAFRGHSLCAVDLHQKLVHRNLDHIRGAEFQKQK
ncbi:hypothetical protein SISNIDRAFT_288720 [Sistotremastrum niveocremeum HHB9708]|uniref:Uncharacterized protein n=1 Tax=Sistotremastrum niveocremeum HHB9708 TaxID=1314777 RepID=A0A164YH79_9AGAM|nr:hypothetical protein SISNIDRAFT_288720 [Sistotremastrum niveocremeum HHB9708]